MQHSIQKKVTDAEYFANRDFVNASKLKILLHKPSLYLELKESDTEAMMFGRAFHCFVLEQNEFDNRFWVMPDKYKGPRTEKGKIVQAYVEEHWDFRKTDHKVAKEKMESENARLSTLKPDEYLAIQKMMESICQFGMQERFLEGGVAEISTFHEDFKWIQVDDTGERDMAGQVITSIVRKSKVKIKTDYLIETDEEIIVTDLKSTRDASAYWFSREVYNMDYDLQMALQVDVLQQHHKKPIKYLWLACEKEAPYCCAWYIPDIAMLNSGREKYRLALKRWEQYLEDGFATTYEAAKYPETLVSPAWKVSKE